MEIHYCKIYLVDGLGVAATFGFLFTNKDMPNVVVG
tara:strand:- start:5595 stop:5702 length:108 start_codon:yes stop_codon:yes gene_type:complete